MPRSNASKSRRRKPPRAEGSKAETTRNPADAVMRRTGIQVVDDMPWGSHICVFYETREDILDTCVTYFEAGLESNEFCIWAVSDPITEADAKASLRRSIADFDRYLAAGQIEIVQGHEWYLKGNQFELRRITGGWSAKLSSALAKGYEGMRVSGNAFWLRTNYWKEFCAYEHELDQSLAGEKMIVMCSYALRAIRAVDILDVARAHQFTIARRNGEWEFMETPELKRAKLLITKLNDALNILSKPFPRHELLTPRERVVLAQIVKGASSKDAARTLGISPRTVEFHRANILGKLGAKNTAELVRLIFAE
jgi:DNA-binding CsgD family transcriptional regulator